MYQLLEKGVLRLSDNKEIKPDRSDVDWLSYQAWVAGGGVPTANAAHAPPPLSYVRALKKSQVNQLRDIKMAAGVLFAGELYDSDAVATLNLTSVLTMVLSGSALPAGFTWRSKNNNNVPMTVADLRGLAGALFQRGQAVYAASWAHKANIDVAADPASYNISGGWPA